MDWFHLLWLVLPFIFQYFKTRDTKTKKALVLLLTILDKDTEDIKNFYSEVNKLIQQGVPRTQIEVHFREKFKELRLLEKLIPKFWDLVWERISK